MTLWVRWVASLTFARLIYAFVASWKLGGLEWPYFYVPRDHQDGWFYGNSNGVPYLLAQISLYDGLVQKVS